MEKQGMADLLRESIARNSDTTRCSDYGKTDLHLTYKQYLNAVFCLKNWPVSFFDKLTRPLHPIKTQLPLAQHESHAPRQSKRGAGACRLQAIAAQKNR
jgi:hypothetical protein